MRHFINPADGYYVSVRDLVDPFSLNSLVSKPQTFHEVANSELSENFELALCFPR
jgi:hypothetical protein